MTQGFPTLQRGTFAPEVGNWQQFLNSSGCRDAMGDLLAVDERFGGKTEYATKSYQAARQLNSTGVLDNTTRNVAVSEGFIAFVLAKNFTPLPDRIYPPERTVRVATIHTMEHPEKPTAAEDVALWIAGKNPKYAAPRASFHYAVDENSIVQCVREKDVAWHAPGVNHDGIGIELDGFASQNREQWDDAKSRLILLRASLLVADICVRYELPVEVLTREELLAGKKGLCGHKTVTDAYPGPQRTHWDPGPNFPWPEFLRRVRMQVEGGS